MTVIRNNSISGINSITAQSTNVSFYDSSGSALKLSAGDILVGTGASVYSPATNTLALGTNSVERVRIDSSGRFGIGTNTLNRDLVLYKASAPAFHIQNSTSGTGSFDGLGIQLAGADAGLWNYENGYLRFGTNDLERLRITSDGNVGIGTDNPSSKFDVQVATKAGINFTTSGQNPIIDFFANSVESAGRIQSFEAFGGGRLEFSTKTTGGTLTSRLMINESGNIGINSTSPAYLLDIASGNASMRLNSTSTSTLVITSGASNAARIEFGDTANNDTGYIYYDNSDDSMRFATNGSNERLRITSGGRLIVSKLQSESVGGGENAIQSGGNISVLRRTNDANGPYLNLGKSRNTSEGSFTIVQDGDIVGSVGFIGDDGTDINSPLAYINGVVDGTPSANSIPGALSFRTTTSGTSTTERLRVSSNGNVTINDGNLIIGTSGHGIDFSVTANGSGTTNSELFDDYEEGSFTPAWGDGSSAYSSPAPTYNTQRGDYTKVGNVVYYDIHIITTAWNGAGGSLWAHGLPFASRSSGYQQGGGGIFCIQGVDSSSAITNLTTQVAPNTTRLEMYYQTAGTGANYNGFGVNQVNEAGTVDIRINGFYFTNS